MSHVRIEAARDGYVLIYVRYHVERRVPTGSRSRDEAEAMAEAIETTLVDEQERKMWRRPDWRPDGLEAPPLARPEAVSFNAPRILKR